MPNSDKVILKVENLKKYFPVRAGVFKRTVANVLAVDDISFEIKEGETLGLVGESGCGKSTTGMTILRLYEPTYGRIIMEEQDTTPWFMKNTTINKYVKKIYADRFEKMKKELGSEEEVIKNLDNEIDKKYAQLYFQNGVREIKKDLSANLNEKRRYFRKNAQVIFQDPYSSLNPRMRVLDIIGEGMKVNKMGTSSEIRDKVANLMETVGLSKDYVYRYPHQFSGGQRQRIGIARALALDPKLIISDEAVSALDVSIQSQIINLMVDLKNDYGLTYVFIAHDLAVVKHISDRIAVMYLGKIAELTSKKDLFDEPLHPYTVSLMSAIPIPDPEVKKKRVVLQGDVPSPLNPPSGCRFHPRCPIAKDICSKEEPSLNEIKPGHYVSCHFPGQFKI
ncbi:ABC transporter ATP-binding protein [Petrotoga olearia]|uniref:Peptide ABC transporter ATP-binding protein n=2 Tax=Petrotoga olearia TaxID=156203 RepID=A0A2K1NZZ1_9BACT|nr:ABC transporter ATP-binding protein [Petrotoga olearia]KUK15992.1 MAG: Oligopeptide/dipeptide ABC transporter, ATPase subunit [Petrotoga mobilis]PNR96090.1 peptide ABC transporter ATP-binding protein [Petrotoga olearia DSM 13574]RMA71523.1 peptide/nickel transport system ATP-binding protein [Petrotoga olearia]HBT51322.1 ABC transporter ATP-binding protein [Petrotoga sp.]